MSETAPSLDRAKETQRLIFISAGVNLFLAFVKTVLGVVANSHSLIADGIHSFSDLTTDLLVWVFNKIGTQAPDEDHPYGHARFETFGTLILGVILLSVAGMIVYESILRLIDIESVLVPTWPALLGALVSIAANEWLYQITHRLGAKLRSNLLMANAWHHRSDSLSSIIVLIGVGGAMLGVVWLEMVAAIGVALLIAKIGWDLSRKSVEELVDTAQSETYVNEIIQNISGVEGVRGVHSIRTRRMGPDVLVDVHLQVEPQVSVSEGHHIGEWVTQGLLNDFDEINDVIFHIDAEDDEYNEEHQLPEIMPPLRKEVRTALSEAWGDKLDPSDIRKMVLHYLNSGVEVELFLTRYAREKHDPVHLPAELGQLGKDLPWFRKVDIWYE